MFPRPSTSAIRMKSGTTGRSDEHMAERLAECYLDRPRQLSLPSTPGSQVNFVGGHATVWYEKDLPCVLRRDDLTIYPSERYRDWYAQWIERCGEHQPARAKIEVGGVVYEPPYTELLAQPLGLADGVSTTTSDAQEAVPATPKRRGRPPKWMRPDVEDSAGDDPDGVEAVGGLDSLDPDIAWDDNYAR